MNTQTKVDMITLGLVNNYLFSLVDEMTLTMIRTAFSPLTRDIFDFQTGFCCADGQVVIEGQGTLLHSLVFPPLIEQWLINNRDTTYPGDVIITNDPYVGDEMGYPGASHLPDIYMLCPVFMDDELVAWSVAGGHQRDVGGAQPGSCATDSTEIYQEGLRIPFMKLYEKGVRNADLYRMIRANCRLPDIIEGDIEAYRAACATGEKRFMEMVDLWGWETVETSFFGLLDYAEKLTRAEISAMPDGEYEFEDFLDDDGQGFLDSDGNEIKDMVKIKVTITVSGDTMTYDFTGTDPQVQGAMNNPVATSRALVASTMRFMMSPDIPRNDGSLRPITLIIPKGTLLNPRLPGAVAARGATAARQQDAMLGAQAMIVPEKAMAAASQVDTLFSLGGHDDENQPFVVMEGGWGGWGGTPFHDGVEFNTPPHLNGANAPMETQEELYPLMYNEYSFAPDTGGAGKHRGSLGVVREYKLLCEKATLQLRVDRQRIGPWGLCGGRPGATLQAVLNPEGENRHINKINYQMKRGEVLRWTAAGAGGWGDPLDRDPGLVEEDVRLEKVSIERARRDYGVVIDETTMTVDVTASEKLRQSMRK